MHVSVCVYLCEGGEGAKQDGNGVSVVTMKGIKVALALQIHVPTHK